MHMHTLTHSPLNTQTGSLSCAVSTCLLQLLQVFVLVARIDSGDLTPTSTSFDGRVEGHGWQPGTTLLIKQLVRAFVGGGKHARSLTITPLLTDTNSRHLTHHSHTHTPSLLHSHTTHMRAGLQAKNALCVACDVYFQYFSESNIDPTDEQQVTGQALRLCERLSQRDRWFVESLLPLASLLPTRKYEPAPFAAATAYSAAGEAGIENGRVVRHTTRVPRSQLIPQRRENSQLCKLLCIHSLVAWDCVCFVCLICLRVCLLEGRVAE